MGEYSAPSYDSVMRYAADNELEKVFVNEALPETHNDPSLLVNGKASNKLALDWDSLIDMPASWPPFGQFSMYSPAHEQLSWPGPQNDEIAQPPCLSYDTKTTFEPKTCGYPGCSDTQVFRQRSAFKKHMDKHRRPYKCTEVNCNTRDFGTKGDLRRHQRALHDTRAFICTIPACKRRGKAFGRKDNLSEHLKRVHGVEHPSSLVTVAGQAEIDMGDDSPESSNDEPSPEMATSKSVSSEKASLTEKLQELENAKEKAVAKFDGDIAALKRVLLLM